MNNPKQYEPDLMDLLALPLLLVFLLYHEVLDQITRVNEKFTNLKNPLIM